MTYDYESLVPGYYDFSRPGPRSRWHRAKFATVEKIVCESAADLLIDLGTGPGVFPRDYCKSVTNRIGFDVSRAQISYAQQFANPQLTFISDLSDIRNILTPQSFNGEEVSICITALELIEHISDEALDEIFRKIEASLKSLLGSKIRINTTWIMTSPNKKSLWPLLERLIDFALGTDYHIQHSNLENNVALAYRAQRILGVQIKRFTFLSFRQWFFGNPPLNPYRRFQFRGMLTLLVAQKVLAQ